MNLSTFLDTYKAAIAQRVVDSYPPQYRPALDDRPLPPLLRTPLGAQETAIRGTAHSLATQRGTTVVGEMGTGKTFIATAAAHLAGFQRILVLVPPHLTRKWQREVAATIPHARAAIVTSITDLERLQRTTGPGPLFAIMSRERAKLAYRWQPAVTHRWATADGQLLRDEATGAPFRVPTCPVCATQVVTPDGVPLTDAELARRKRRCGHCGAALWQADRRGPRRYPLADYVKLRMPGWFDLLIADEVHEYKGRGSAQGIAAGILADVCGTLPGPHRHPGWRLCQHALPPALPLLAGPAGRVRTSRGGVPLDRPLRLCRAHRPPAGRRAAGGRAPQPAPPLSHRDPRTARPGAGGPVPPDRAYRLPAPGRRGQWLTALHRAGAPGGPGRHPG